MIKFNENNTIKTKHYFINCIIKHKKNCLIIIIINDKYTFFANIGV